MSTTRPIAEVATELGFAEHEFAAFGPRKAKLDHRLATGERKRGMRYVLVTAISPTPAGEGKTVTAIGLSMALAKGGARAVCALRQPSLGPVFGVKGGGAGASKSGLYPADEINLHLLGDTHAVGVANNLLAAAIDTSMLLDNPLRIDPERVQWNRVVDINDRALRSIRIGLGGARNGIPRDTSFDITAASEVMSVLGMATGIEDLRRRLDEIVVARCFSGRPIRARDLEVTGAMTALLRDALDPNLVQTMEGSPALVHTGPFANISFGNSSVLADRLAARYADWVVTEAGFGADMGAEKFFNLKCRASGLAPDVAVMVATVRGLKAHSGRYELVPGGNAREELEREDLDALALGMANLEAQVENVLLHGIPVVVAINRFSTDTDAELDLLRERALEAGARRVAVSDVFASGSGGARELAEAVAEVADSGEASLRFLYEDDAPIRDKIWSVATQLYGAESVRFSPLALEQLQRLEEWGYGELPVCIAKTQFSLSHDPSLRGRPRDYEFPVREVRLCAGAGFAVPMAGSIMSMPGMGRTPAYKKIDVDPDGTIRGIS